jgi:hypothetical protein
VPGVHQRLAALLPGRTLFLGTAAADLRPDLELPDLSQRRRGQRRGGPRVEGIAPAPVARQKVPKTFGLIGWALPIYLAPLCLTTDLGKAVPPPLW